MGRATWLSRIIRPMVMGRRGGRGALMCSTETTTTRTARGDRVVSSVGTVNVYECRQRRVRFDGGEQVFMVIRGSPCILDPSCAERLFPSVVELALRLWSCFQQRPRLESALHRDNAFFVPLAGTSYSLLARPRAHIQQCTQTRSSNCFALVNCTSNQFPAPTAVVLMYTTNVFCYDAVGA